MPCLLNNLEHAARCTQELQQRVDRLSEVIRVRRLQGQDIAAAEALMGVLHASVRQAAIRRDLIVLQMRLRLLGLAQRITSSLPAQ